jgi:hypothetical protein
MIADYFDKAQEWVKLFVSLRDKAIGYKKANMAPYMLWFTMFRFSPQKFKTVKLFTGQGVEKNNDVARTIVLRKSNKISLQDFTQRQYSNLRPSTNRKHFRAFVYV